MLSQAKCTATSEEEQAVSTVKLGPLKSKKYERRFAAMQPVFPGNMNGSLSGIMRRSREAQSKEL